MAKHRALVAGLAMKAAGEEQASNPERPLGSR